MCLRCVLVIVVVVVRQVGQPVRPGYRVERGVVRRVHTEIGVAAVVFLANVDNRVPKLMSAKNQDVSRELDLDGLPEDQRAICQRRRDDSGARGTLSMHSRDETEGRLRELSTQTWGT